MNKYNWSLDALYTSFGSEKFVNDKLCLKKLIKHMQEWVAKNLNDYQDIVQKLETFLEMQNSLGDLSLSLCEYAELSLSTNAENQIALNELEFLEDILTQTSSCIASFDTWVSQIKNPENYINSSEFLKEHSFYLNQEIQNSKHSLSPEKEDMIAKLKTTGSSAWEKLYDLLTSTLKIPLLLNGKTEVLPLSSIRNLAYSKDGHVRKAAYDAEMSAYPSIAVPVSACLNGIKGEVMTISEIRGYSSPLEKTILDSRIDPEILESMISVMKENQDMFRDYFRKKAELLGHKDGIPFYDLFAPIGSLDFQYTYEEAQAFILEHFYEFSSSLGDYAKKAFENQWIDVFPENGKRGGAFCSNLHAINESRILVNFNGSFNDVVTIAHELGHGYHGECLKNQSFLNNDYPMTIAETASTFCETIIKSAALKNAASDQRMFILESDIQDSAQIIVDILSRFLFEDMVFSERKHGSLSVSKLCSLMLDAQEQTYGIGLSKDTRHKYMWICKPHYYDADYNYYNFPYAFGLLFSRGLYAKYLSEGNSFVAKYNHMLSISGKMPLSHIALDVGINIRDKSFWEKSILTIKKDISLFLNI